MLAAAYSRVYTSSKFQVQSHKALIDLAFVPAALIVQLFLHYRNDSIKAMLVKIAYDILLSGLRSTTYRTIQNIDSLFSIGTNVDGPKKSTTLVSL